MKKLHILFLFVCVWCLSVQQTKAQFSIGGAGAITYYIDGNQLNQLTYVANTFPVTNTADLPIIIGGRLTGSYGFLESNAIRVGFGYNKALGDMNFMLGAIGSMASIEGTIDYVRYLKGSYNDMSGLYVLGGFGFTHNMLTFNVPDPVAMGNTGELKFFNDRAVQLASFNLGLGGETLVMNSFYAFAEASTAIHMNVYVDNTTVKQSNLMYYVRGSVGFRVPLGGGGNKKLPRRKRF
jgi:hypothetical protein